MPVATACTATTHATGHIVRVACVWSFPSTTAGTLRVFRSTPAGGVQELRTSQGIFITAAGASSYAETLPLPVGPGALASGTPAAGGLDFTVTVIDPEPPQGALPSYYFVAKQGGTTITSSASTPTQPTRGADFLYDVGAPDARGMAVTVIEVDDMASASRDEVLEVIGRRSPVIIRDLRTNPSFKLVLSTETDAQARVMRALLFGGNPLALSPLAANYGIDAPIYFNAGDIVEQRVTKLGRESTRFWQIDAQVIDPPPLYAGVLASSVFFDLATTYATYAPVTLGTTLAPFGLGMSGTATYDPDGFGT